MRRSSFYVCLHDLFFFVYACISRPYRLIMGLLVSCLENGFAVFIRRVACIPMRLSRNMV